MIKVRKTNKQNIPLIPFDTLFKLDILSRQSYYERFKNQEAMDAGKVAILETRWTFNIQSIFIFTNSY